MLRAAPDDPGTQSNVQISLDNLGRVLLARGENDGALDAFRRSLALASQRAAATPDDAAIRKDVASLHSNIGFALATRGDHRGALEHYRSALAIMEHDAAARPEDNDAATRFASALFQLAREQRALRDFAGAAASYRRCLEIYTRAAERDPADRDGQTSLADIHDQLGELALEESKPAEALREARLALGFRERLPVAASLPDRAEGVALAATYTRIGAALHRLARHADAHTAYVKGRALLEKLRTEQPPLTADEQKLLDLIDAALPGLNARR